MMLAWKFKSKNRLIAVGGMFVYCIWLAFTRHVLFPFLFQAEIEQASENAGELKEHAWDEQKIGEKWREGEREGEGSGEKGITPFTASVADKLNPACLFATQASHSPDKSLSRG